MSRLVLKDRVSLFRQFLSGLYDAVVITDPSGHVLELNESAENLFGYSQDEARDRPVSLFIPRLTSEVVERISRHFDQDRRVIVTASGKTRTGAKVASEIAVSRLSIADPDDLVFVIRNMEGRRAVMDGYRAKANAFDEAPVALFGCDPTGHIRDANAAFCDLFALANVEEARRCVFADLMGDDPLPANFAKALAGKKTVTHLVAEGDEGDRANLTITLAPNMHGERNHGVVGCIQKD